jgi:hypothetical protein
MSIEEAILEKVRLLPPAKKAEVLRYVSDIGAPGKCRFEVPKEFWLT